MTAFVFCKSKENIYICGKDQPKWLLSFFNYKAFNFLYFTSSSFNYTDYIQNHFSDGFHGICWVDNILLAIFFNRLKLQAITHH